MNLNPTTLSTSCESESRLEAKLSPWDDPELGLTACLNVIAAGTFTSTNTLGPASVSLALSSTLPFTRAYLPEIRNTELFSTLPSDVDSCVRLLSDALAVACGRSSDSKIVSCTKPYTLALQGPTPGPDGFTPSPAVSTIYIAAGEIIPHDSEVIEFLQSIWGEVWKLSNATSPAGDQTSMEEQADAFNRQRTIAVMVLNRELAHMKDYERWSLITDQEPVTRIDNHVDPSHMLMWNLMNGSLLEIKKILDGIVCEASLLASLNRLLSVLEFMDEYFMAIPKPDKFWSKLTKTVNKHAANKPHGAPPSFEMALHTLLIWCYDNFVVVSRCISLLLWLPEHCKNAATFCETLHVQVVPPADPDIEDNIEFLPPPRGLRPSPSPEAGDQSQTHGSGKDWLKILRPIFFDDENLSERRQSEVKQLEKYCQHFEERCKAFKEQDYGDNGPSVHSACSLILYLDRTIHFTPSESSVIHISTSHTLCVVCALFAHAYNFRDSDSDSPRPALHKSMWVKCREDHPRPQWWTMPILAWEPEYADVRSRLMDLCDIILGTLTSTNTI
ncbi:hypothetical protein BXZ70DRAFT_1065323 [Cristinia sonorae]|uniref:Uncharacterized protein n=1 Tax=Cristinia sonorae TaxID=1940300 RepID=A0A8K0XP77_9AGAR|nr:hypothetical protein BXZ70DRAFT_1065323 [Cristinia sonorae]